MATCLEFRRVLFRSEASPATTKSAPLETTLAALSVTIASEVASFLTAKVPPKPQQESDSGRLTTSMPSTARSSFRRSEEHTSELQSRGQLVCRLLLEKQKKGQT